MKKGKQVLGQHKKLVIVSLLILAVGFLLGGFFYKLIVSSIFTSINYIWNHQIILSSLIIIIGWFITAFLNRRMQSEQFVLDKKFKAFEKIQSTLSNYGILVSDVSMFLSSLQSKLNIDWLRNGYDRWNYVNYDVTGKWLDAQKAYIELLRTFENYEIALLEIDEVLKKFKEKNEEINKYFIDNFLLDNRSYVQLGTNAAERELLGNRLRRAQDEVNKHSAYISDATKGFQNRLFADVFRRKLTKRVPKISMDVIE